MSYNASDVMKIFCQLGVRKTLSPVSGDQINEINFMIALSQFAEVYYSGTRFDPSKKDYGLTNYSESIESRVTDKYDIYYIRRNINVFKAVPATKPKLWFAIVYDTFCFQNATAVLTQTETCAQSLRDGKQARAHLKKYPHAVSIHQVVGSHFQSLQHTKKTAAIRKSFGGSFILGYFGQINRATYPHALFSLMPRLARKYPELRLIVGVNINDIGDLPRLPNTVFTTFNYEDMPYVTSACDLVVTSQYGYSWDYGGNLKVVEAAACGVPIILGRSKARMELLGKDYELFLPPLRTRLRWRDTFFMRHMIERVINDEHLRMRIAQRLPRQAKFYSVEESAKRLQLLFESFCRASPHAERAPVSCC